MLIVHDNTLQFSMESSERLIIKKAYLSLAFPSVGLKFGWNAPLEIPVISIHSQLNSTQLNGHSQ